MLGAMNMFEQDRQLIDEVTQVEQEASQSIGIQQMISKSNLYDMIYSVTYA